MNAIFRIQHPTQSSAEADIEGQARPPSKLPRPPDWTIVHGFYAGMGGFTFETRDLRESEQFLPGSVGRVALTERALYALAIVTPQLLPQVSRQEIEDKSKANGLAKIVTSLQALWFTVQCIQRIAQGLSISTLELNTGAHAIFALVSFLLWFKKPVDIDQPTVIREPPADGFCSLLHLATQDPSQCRVMLEKASDYLKSNNVAG